MWNVWLAQSGVQTEESEETLYKQCDRTFRTTNNWYITSRRLLTFELSSYNKAIFAKVVVSTRSMAQLYIWELNSRLTRLTLLTPLGEYAADIYTTGPERRWLNLSLGKNAAARVTLNPPESNQFNIKFMGYPRTYSNKKNNSVEDCITWTYFFCPDTWPNCLSLQINKSISQHSMRKGEPCSTSFRMQAFLTACNGFNRWLYCFS